MHRMRVQVNIGFKYFIYRVLPAAHQFAESRLLAFNRQRREIGFGLPVKQPYPLTFIDHHHRFLHTVEHQFIQTADTIKSLFVLGNRFGRGFQVFGGKRSKCCHQITCAHQHETDQCRSGFSHAISERESLITQQQTEQDQHARIAGIQ